MEKWYIYSSTGWDRNEYLTIILSTEYFGNTEDGNHRMFCFILMILRLLIIFGGIIERPIPFIEYLPSEPGCLPVFQVNAIMMPPETSVEFRYQYSLYENNKASEVFSH